MDAPLGRLLSLASCPIRFTSLSCRTKSCNTSSRSLAKCSWMGRWAEAAMPESWPNKWPRTDSFWPSTATARAVAAAEQTLAGLPIKVAQANFCDLPELLRDLGLPAVDGVLLDLGLSSDQLADGTRGFSFDASGPLDLRFDPTQGEPAWQLLERLREQPLADLIYQYGEERFSRRIARKIVEIRRTAADSDRRPIGTACSLLRAAEPRAWHRSGDTDFSSDSHRRQRRIGLVAACSEVHPRLLASRRPVRRDQFPFSGGSIGQRGISQRSAAAESVQEARPSQRAGVRRESSQPQRRTARCRSPSLIAYPDACSAHRLTD